MRSFRIASLLCLSNFLLAQLPQPMSSVEGGIEEGPGRLPVAGLEVNLRGAGKTGQVETDARGHFAFTGLPPGNYTIFVTRDKGFVPAGKRVNLQAGQDLTGVTLQIDRVAVLAGKVIDSESNSVEHAKVSIRAEGYKGGRKTLTSFHSTSTDDRGQYRMPNLVPGRYIVEVDTPPLQIRPRLKPPKTPDDDSAPVIAPVRTYYPTATSVDAATLLTLGPGEQSLDLALLKIPTFCVTSKIVDLASAGTSRLRVYVAETYPKSQSRVATGSAASGDDIEVCGIGPGAYRLWSSAVDSSGDLRYASESFTVAKRSVRLPPLSLSQARPLSGTVTVYGAKPDEAFPKGLGVRVEPKDRIYVENESADAELQPDGAFVFRNMLLDDYWLSIDGLPSGYYVREASMAGRESYANPFRPGGGNLHIVLGADGPIVSGVVQDKDGQPVAGAAIFLVLSPLPVIPAPNQVISGRTGDDGSFSLTGMAPGRYGLIAFANLSEALSGDPEFARSNLSKALEFDLSPHEQKLVKITPIEGVR